jgi:hypothetical protein
VIIEKNSGGRSPKKLTVKDIIQVEALAAVCTKSQIARHFDMTEKTFRAIKARQPEIFTAYSMGRARAIAEVGSALLEKALSGNIRAMQFYLKTRAEWREKSTSEEFSNENRTFSIEIVQPEGAS